MTHRLCPHYLVVVFTLQFYSLLKNGINNKAINNKKGILSCPQENYQLKLDSLIPSMSYFIFNLFAWPSNVINCCGLTPVGSQAQCSISLTHAATEWRRDLERQKGENSWAAIKTA